MTKTEMDEKVGEILASYERWDISIEEARQAIIDLIKSLSFTDLSNIHDNTMI